MVLKFAVLFNCLPVGRISNSMTVPNKSKKEGKDPIKYHT